MVTIQEYKDKIIKMIEELISKAGLSSYEITDATKEMARAYPELKDWAEKMATWRDSILEASSMDAIDVYHKGYSNLVHDLMNKKHEKQRQESKDYDQKNKEWWENYYKKQQTNKEWLRKYLANELDWQKDQKKRDEENRKKLDKHKENLKNDDKEFNEKNKKKYIADVEMDLIKKNISAEQLNKRLGVSDWREKINGASDAWEALSRRSDLWDIIRELKYDNPTNNNEFTCAGCGEKKTEYYKYPLEGGIKYCSSECWNKGENGNDKKDSPANRGGKFKHFSISDFFTLMKKLNAKEIRFDFSTNQIMIEFNGGQSQKLDSVDSGLSSEQKQRLESELKSVKQPVTFSQVSDQYNKKGPNNKGNGNVGVIAAIVIVGIIFAVIVGAVIYKNKKRDY